MRYTDFAQIMTPARMNRYLTACGGNSRKAMTLYRKNLQLTQELFTVVGCYEIALRNAIDAQCVPVFGNDWLRDGASSGGIFDTANCRFTRNSINESITKLHTYNHFKLIAELGFGFWRYLFAQHQYNATNRILLQIFPLRPSSTPALHYNNTYVFNQLAAINQLRNRMAHHEPICFLPGRPIKDTHYARQHYQLVLQLFQWMAINETTLLYGLDHIRTICDEIDRL